MLIEGNPGGDELAVSSPVKAPMFMRAQATTAGPHQPVVSETLPLATVRHYR